MCPAIYCSTEIYIYIYIIGNYPTVSKPIMKTNVHQGEFRFSCEVPKMIKNPLAVYHIKWYKQDYDFLFKDEFVNDTSYFIYDENAPICLGSEVIQYSIYSNSYVHYLGCILFTLLYSLRNVNTMPSRLLKERTFRYFQPVHVIIAVSAFISTDATKYFT